MIRFIYLLEVLPASGRMSRQRWLWFSRRHSDAHSFSHRMLQSIRARPLTAGTSCIVLELYTTCCDWFIISTPHISTSSASSYCKPPEEGGGNMCPPSLRVWTCDKMNGVHYRWFNNHQTIMLFRICIQFIIAVFNNGCFVSGVGIAYLIYNF